MVCCFPAATEFMYTLRIKPAVASENNKPGGEGEGRIKTKINTSSPPLKNDKQTKTNESCLSQKTTDWHLISTQYQW